MSTTYNIPVFEPFVQGLIDNGYNAAQADTICRCIWGYSDPKSVIEIATKALYRSSQWWNSYPDWSVSVKILNSQEEKSQPKSVNRLFMQQGKETSTYYVQKSFSGCHLVPFAYFRGGEGQDLLQRYIREFNASPS